MTEFVTDRHLGGYIRGGDEATYYPELWRWLVEEYGVRSVIDVGCGEGHALNFFRDIGCRVAGVDGIAQGDPDIFEHDYASEKAYFPPAPHPWDLTWSCEFVEHVEAKFIHSFLITFACADLVLMTHASPGQSGYHHVNLQGPEYWKGVMAAIGYEHDEVLTAATRELAAENTNPYNHYVRSGLAFKRHE